MRWNERRSKLWRGVINALEKTDRATSRYKAPDLIMYVNYGDQVELADAARSTTKGITTGRFGPRDVAEEALSHHPYLPGVPDVNLTARTPGK